MISEEEEEEEEESACVLRFRCVDFANVTLPSRGEKKEKN
jgi:hypothetical protein